MDRVDAFAGRFLDLVRYIVDPVDVVPEATGHQVRPGATGQLVVTVTPDERVVSVGAVQSVVETVADQRQRGRSCAGAQELDLLAARQRVVDTDIYRIETFGRCLEHLIGRRVDVVEIVPGATGHRVDTGAADQPVVPAATDEDIVSLGAIQSVVEAVAGQRQRGHAGIRTQELDLLAIGERVVDAGKDHIGALTDRFLYLVRRIVDVVRIVTRAAAHQVGTRAADQLVVAPSAVQRVVARGAVDPVGKVVAGQREAGHARIGAQEFDLLIRGQGEVDAGIDRIDAFARQFDDHITGIVDEVDVVTGPAVHRIRAGSADEPVGVSTADEGIGTLATVEVIVPRAAVEGLVQRGAVDRVVA